MTRSALINLEKLFYSEGFLITQLILKIKPLKDTLNLLAHLVEIIVVENKTGSSLIKLLEMKTLEYSGYS